jgi:hypothetical protein
MPRKANTSGENGHFKAPSKLLDESNVFSVVPDKRSAQADFYRLENRDKQLAAIQNLTDAEVKYVLNDNGASANEAATTALKKAINKIHEKDLIELRSLVYLQKLPDTSPELIQLKALCGCESREDIARYIADKHIKKLMMSQIDAITGGDALTTVYKTTIKTGADAFKGLFG